MKTRELNRAHYNDQIAWRAQAGSQSEFLKCPAFEVLFHGMRGPGKTDALLMSFAGKIGKGYGSAWRGIIFRKTYSEFADLIAKSSKWFKVVFGDNARFNRATNFWEWTTGERLYFRQLRIVDDYWKYHGHEYPFIGFEEITNWATDDCYTRMFSCCRSSTPGMPRMIRATTNPYGPGHNWVKKRFNLGSNWTKTKVSFQDGHYRCAIFGSLLENKVLMESDPDYINNILTSANNPELKKAWLYGSWDIVAGGMFGDLWNPKVHVLDQFRIPASWKVYRSFDWGSSAPFSVGWWALSDGTNYITKYNQTKATIRGDLFRINEWYGCESGKENVGIRMLACDIARGINDLEKKMNLPAKIHPGPADSAIFTVENGVCLAFDMINEGVYWLKADKRPFSRKRGWENVREMLRNSQSFEGLPREKPGLFVFNTCEDFVRTLPILQRSDKDLDDIVMTSEDHIADETRYMVSHLRNTSKVTILGSGFY